MDDLKELKRLAAMCRKAGIKHFKNEKYEFTLTEEAPVSVYKQAKSKKTQVNQAVDSNYKVESDGLNEDELLFWSTGSFDEPSDSVKE